MRVRQKHMKICGTRLIRTLLIALACVAGLVAFSVGIPRAAPRPQDEPPLLIQNDAELPNAYPRTPYEYRFHPRGGVPVLQWRVEKGALPPGMKLEDDGRLHGAPEHKGEFQFTVSVQDGSNP